MHKARFQDSLGSGLVKKWGEQSAEGKHPSGVLSSLRHLKPLTQTTVRGRHSLQYSCHPLWPAGLRDSALVLPFRT